MHESPNAPNDSEKQRVEKEKETEEGSGQVEEIQREEGEVSVRHWEDWLTNAVSQSI